MVWKDIRRTDGVGDAYRRVCYCDATLGPGKEMDFERNRVMIDGTWPPVALTGELDEDMPSVVRAETAKSLEQVKSMVMGCDWTMGFFRILEAPAIGYLPDEISCCSLTSLTVDR